MESKNCLYEKEQMSIAFNEFIEKAGILDCRTVKYFESKKNKVSLIEALCSDGSRRRYVYKEYRNGQAAEKEAAMLKILKERSVNAPELYYSGQYSCLMGFIPGETLCDIIHSIETAEDIEDEVKTERAVQMGVKLCNWLKGFYSASEKAFGESIILGDVNLRNFIFQDEITGIDFEDYTEGLKEQDAGRICAYLMTYTPSYTGWKMDIAHKWQELFCKGLDIDKEKLMFEISNGLTELEKRRKERLKGAAERDFYKEQFDVI